MTIFLILAPFGSFALLMLVTSAEISLFASAAICLVVIGIDVYRGRSIKMLGAFLNMLLHDGGCHAHGALVSMLTPQPELHICAFEKLIPERRVSACTAFISLKVNRINEARPNPIA